MAGAGAAKWRKPSMYVDSRGSSKRICNTLMKRTRVFKGQPRKNLRSFVVRQVMSVTAAFAASYLVTFPGLLCGREMCLLVRAVAGEKVGTLMGFDTSSFLLLVYFSLWSTHETSHGLFRAVHILGICMATSLFYVDQRLVRETGTFVGISQGTASHPYVLFFWRP